MPAWEIAISPVHTEAFRNFSASAVGIASLSSWLVANRFSISDTDDIENQNLFLILKNLRKHFYRNEKHLKSERGLFDKDAKKTELAVLNYFLAWWAVVKSLGNVVAIQLYIL